MTVFAPPGLCPITRFICKNLNSLLRYTKMLPHPQHLRPSASPRIGVCS